jgi:hypothetical protein
MALPEDPPGSLTDQCKTPGNKGTFKTILVELLLQYQDLLAQLPTTELPESRGQLFHLSYKAGRAQPEV